MWSVLQVLTPKPKHWTSLNLDILMVQEIIQEGKMDVCELSGLHSASVAKKSIKRSLYFSLFSYLCVCFVRYRFAHIFY